jgi:DNA-binding IclR family transcriptional regulator
MLGAKPFYLGMLYQETFRIWDYAAPVMRTLVRDTKETAAIYIREGNDRVCLHRMVQPRAVRMHVREGEIVELDKGAAGKVLLAFSGEKGERFDMIRQSFYSVSLSERGSEAAAIACPIFGPKQTLICAISLGMPVFRFDRKVFKEFLPLVMSAAAAITKKCGGDPTVFSPPYKHMSKVNFATKK